MVKYANALKEVYVILGTMEEDDYEKIPKNTIKAIEENMNEDYLYYINEDEDLNKQIMLPETKAILFNFFRDYWATPEQREKILKMQKEERIANEEKKKEMYKNLETTFPKQEREKSSIKEESQKVENNSANREVAIVEYKESIIRKIINKIKSFFGR